MVELTCAICDGIWSGEVGEVDCPWCGGPNVILVTGGTIVVTSIENIDDAIEILEHDKQDEYDNMMDSQWLLVVEQSKFDGYEESILEHEIDIEELENKKHTWEDMGIE